MFESIFYFFLIPQLPLILNFQTVVYSVKSFFFLEGRLFNPFLLLLLVVVKYIEIFNKENSKIKYDGISIALFMKWKD